MSDGYGYLVFAGDKTHPGPAVVDVKVHLGEESYSALGAFGRWNVRPWSDTVEGIWEGKIKPA